MKKLLTSLCAFAMIATSVLTQAPTVSAASSETPENYKTLASYVLGNSTMATTTDYYVDTNTDSFDMVVLKRILCGIIEPEPEEEVLIDAPLNAFSTTTPRLGDAKICVFRITFPDLDYNNGLSAEQMQPQVFGPENTSSPNYPFESLTAFYDRASYGNLDLNGDIYAYTTQHERSYYSNDTGFEALFMEALDYYDDTVDFSQYDCNNDGYFDGISCSVPLDGSGGTEDNEWWGFQSSFYHNSNYSVDNIGVRAFIINDAQPTSSGMSYYVQVLAHELGHSMGLPDYYKYNSNPSEGMMGAAGGEMMDDMTADFTQFSKLVMGWLTEDDVQVADFETGSQTYLLDDASSEGSCLIVPVGTLDENYFSEYFLIEYNSITRNNSASWYANNGGIRILHVNAAVIQSPYDYRSKIFKYENYSPDYDSSDNGIRILRLVNDNGGYYSANSTISYGVSGFGAYDSSGKETIDPGFSISIGQLTDGQYSITITK